MRPTIDMDLRNSFANDLVEGQMAMTTDAIMDWFNDAHSYEISEDEGVSL